MQRRNFLALGLLALLTPGAAEARPPPRPARTRRGIAVWYGEDRHGRTMANGRPFDQRAMTAASVHFPLGARVRVTDLATRRSVTVTITDRTIPRSKVLIDLSQGAGRALGIETRGRARVEVTQIGFDQGQARRRS